MSRPKSTSHRSLLLYYPFFSSSNSISLSVHSSNFDFPLLCLYRKLNVCVCVCALCMCWESAFVSFVLISRAVFNFIWNCSNIDNRNVSAICNFKISRRSFRKANPIAATKICNRKTKWADVKFERNEQVEKKKKYWKLFLQFDCLQCVQLFANEMMFNFFSSMSR